MGDVAMVGGCMRGDDGGLRLGGVRLSELARGPHGTPSYVYDLDGMASEANELTAAFAGAPHLVAYALKANSAGPVVRALAAAGCGADVVSGAELAVALGAGVPAASIVFSGVAKTDAEIDAAIAAGIAAIQVESVEEIGRVAARAQELRRRVALGIRVNPGLEKNLLGTHDHVATGHDAAKFGVARVDLPAAFERIGHFGDVLVLAGLASHVGSQLTRIEPYVQAAEALFHLAGEVRRSVAPALSFVDCGGGFGIDYGAGCVVRPADFVRAARVVQLRSGAADLALYVEPGRSVVGAHGVLIASVIQEKRSGTQRWIFVDAGMNDLVRPAMYGCHHRIVPLEIAPDDASKGQVTGGGLTRVAGPVCESSDDFGLHEMPEAAPRDVAVLDAGAYGFTMASRYNGRPLPAELFLAGGRLVHAISREGRAVWVDERLHAGESLGG